MITTEGASGLPPVTAHVAALSTQGKSFHTIQLFQGKTLDIGGHHFSFPKHTRPTFRTALKPKRTRPTQWRTVR